MVNTTYRLYSQLDHMFESIAPHAVALLGKYGDETTSKVVGSCSYAFDSPSRGQGTPWRHVHNSGTSSIRVSTDALGLEPHYGVR